MTQRKEKANTRRHWLFHPHRTYEGAYEMHLRAVCQGVKMGCIYSLAPMGQEWPHSTLSPALLDCACLSAEWIPGTVEPQNRDARTGSKQCLKKDKVRPVSRCACAKLLKACWGTGP